MNAAENEVILSGEGAVAAAGTVAAGSQSDCVFPHGHRQEKGQAGCLAGAGKDAVSSRRAGRRPGRDIGDAGVSAQDEALVF